MRRAPRPATSIYRDEVNAKMIRLFHSYFPARIIALFVSEALLIAAALLAAFWLSMRDETGLALYYDQGMYRLAVATVVCLVCMYFYDMYDPLVLCDARHTSTRLVEALGMACMVLAAVYYAYPAARLRAQVFLVGIPVSGAALTLWRGLFSMLTRLPRFQEPVLLLGQGPFAEALAVNIQARPAAWPAARPRSADRGADHQDPAAGERCPLISRRQADLRTPRGADRDLQLLANSRLCSRLAARAGCPGAPGATRANQGHRKLPLTTILL